MIVRPDGVEFLTADGEPLEREIVEIDWDADTAEKQGYETFMLKEIHEQADAVAETIGERAAPRRRRSTSATSARSTTSSCATSAGS